MARIRTVYKDGDAKRTIEGVAGPSCLTWANEYRDHLPEGEITPTEEMEQEAKVNEIELEKETN